jgi:uncharacterized membrane protein
MEIKLEIKPDKKNFLLNVILFLIVINALVSFYLYLSELENQPIICIPNSGCAKVLKSEYSQIYGMSISLLGFIYFIFLFLLTLVAFVNKDFISAGVIFSFLGFIFSIYLIYLQFNVIKDYCVYCLIVDSVTIVIFLLYLITAILVNNIKKFY